MEKHGFGESRVMGWIVVAFDTLLAMVCLGATELLLSYTNPEKMAHGNLYVYMWIVAVCYVLSSVWVFPIVNIRQKHFYRIIERTVLKMVTFAMLVTSFLFAYKETQLLRFFFSSFLIIFFLALLLVRLVEHHFFVRHYQKEEYSHNALMVAPGGLRSRGYEFLRNNSEWIRMVLSNKDLTSDDIPTGPCSEQSVVAYLDAHPEINLLFFVPSDADSSLGPMLVQQTRNRMVTMYVVSDFLMGEHVHLEPVTFNDSWLMSTARFPLQDMGNRFLKRTFDVVFSLLFLITFYPIIYAVVFIVIKIQSPGPVYFKQRRSGLNGKDFTCIKFRSMHMNDQADTVQATKDDPRKFPFGDFMRKTNIDELPQLICILKGDMSFVGPRPHMLAHTEQYRKLIDEYMMRHMAKPGLSGWAQVTGYRGETRELSQMEGRIQKDIWYIENWSMSLDVFIIFKTLWNLITRQDDMAY